MEAVCIAALAAVSAVLIVNLGLGEAIAKVSGKILQCPICLTFWGSLAALLLYRTDIIVAVLLSIAASYLSNFLGIVLMMCNRLYDWLYGKAKNEHNED